LFHSISVYKYEETQRSNSLTIIHHTLLEEMVLYRTLKGSISATYLEPLKGSIHSLKKGSSGFCIGSILGQ